MAMKQIFVELPTVARMLTLSESTVQAMVRLGSGHFPQPRQISVRRVGWLLREIEEWPNHGRRPTFHLHPTPEQEDRVSLHRSSKILQVIRKSLEPPCPLRIVSVLVVDTKHARQHVPKY